MIRVLSNQAVHNGFVKLEDQPHTVAALFWLVNYVVEQMVSKPKQIQALFAGLPQDKRDAITKRDEKK